MEIKKTNAILKRPINKLVPIEYTYHDTNQTDKARKHKLRWEAAVTGELNFNCGNIGREEESLNIININLLNRRKIFPSDTRVLSILLATAATNASVEKVNSKERVPSVPCSIPAASYAEMWALCSNNPANV